MKINRCVHKFAMLPSLVLLDDREQRKATDNAHEVQNQTYFVALVHKERGYVLNTVPKERRDFLDEYFDATKSIDNYLDRPETFTIPQILGRPRCELQLVKTTFNFFLKYWNAEVTEPGWFLETMLVTKGANHNLTAVIESIEGKITKSLDEKREQEDFDSLLFYIGHHISEKAYMDLAEAYMDLAKVQGPMPVVETILFCKSNFLIITDDKKSANKRAIERTFKDLGNKMKIHNDNRTISDQEVPWYLKQLHYVGYFVYLRFITPTPPSEERIVGVAFLCYVPVYAALYNMLLERQKKLRQPAFFDITGKPIVEGREHTLISHVFSCGAQ